MQFKIFGKQWAVAILGFFKTHRNSSNMIKFYALLTFFYTFRYQIEDAIRKRKGGVLTNVGMESLPVPASQNFP